MIEDTSSRNTKMCHLLACGCRRVCACNIKTAHKQNNRSNQHSVGTDYWSPNVCRPWISTWFDTTEKEKGHNTYLESGCESNEKQAPNIGTSSAKQTFPTQSRRIQYNECTSVPSNPILPPSHSIIGHPSLKIYKFRLPHHLLNLLDHIVDGCHDHASNLPTGWM